MDKELLFKPRLTEAEVEVPGVGTVRVRTMTREELHTLKDVDTGVGERKVLAACLVDPVLTEEEVLRWQRAAGVAELSGVVDRILELSGLLDGADKSGLPGVRGKL